ncbi:MAG: M1 family aminopeptidase [Acidobacteriota bacterium]|nr:M1 family aminopeptidase [Acidobacteriota bacterium]
MMFQIARFEFRYMTRSFSTLVLFTVLLGLSFLLTANSGEFLGAARGGNVYINSPYMITLTLMIMGIFSVFIVPLYMAGAVLKDTDNNFDGILFATPVTKKSFLAGRFLGAFSALILAFSAAPLGMLLGSFSPWADPATLAPHRVEHYAVVFFGFLTPSLLVVAALTFSVAVMTKRLLHTYIVAFALFILYMGVSETNAIGPLWDPFMHRIMEETTEYWTAAERNTRLLSYEGIVLANRALWLGIAVVFFGLAYHRFSFRTARRKPSKRQPESETVRPKGFTGKLTAKPIWDRRTSWSQFFARARFEISSTLGSFPFLVVVCLSSGLVVLSLLDREVMYEVNAYPLTRLMISAITGANWWALLAILGFYSADILVRERTDKFHEIMDAMPVSNGVIVTSKLLALLMIMNVTLVIGVGFAVALQVYDGNVPVEWTLYLERIFLFFVLPYVYLAILACFFQVLVPNRLVGMVLMGLFILFSIGMNDLLGSEHPLLKYALGGFYSPYSDMNGAGRFAAASYWLRAYWAGLAGLLLLLTYNLWNRGTLQPLRIRLRALKTRANTAVASALVFISAGTGAFIYYNTNILNQFVTRDDANRLRVDFEKRFRQYRHLPMPRVIDVSTEVALFPHQARVETTGAYRLENKTGDAIATVHMIFPNGVEVPKAMLEGARETSRDETFNYFIFDLDTPMQPGETRTLAFETIRQHKGFRYGTPDTSLVRNGTFITNNKLTPYIGFNEDYLLSDRDERRAFGLDPLPRIPALEDTRQHHNSVNRQDSDFITFRTTVSTSADQIAVAPGVLEKEWTEGDRRYFTYKMSTPMMHMYAYVSAEYEVMRDQWNGVALEIYHHEPHTYNLTRMMEGVKDSLEVFSEAFSPYQYKQVRILEFPSYRSFAQSFANTIPYSEGLGFVADVREDDIDLPYYITAHEMAHQWWGHQVTAANCQGASMLNETLAQYSALMVMERKYGKNKIHKFLALELDRYLSGRADDPEGELPLYRVENQKYIHYRKGSLVMYALRDYLGANVINRALQRLIELRAFRSAPYATSADFLRLLREEAGPEHASMITDFFEKITLYDLKVESVEAEELSTGGFEVRLKVSAAKFYADAVGNESRAPFDIPVDLGLFLENPAAEGFSEDDVIYLQKQVMDGPTADFTFVVDRKPRFVGIDPYHKLIDRKVDDNLVAVQ